MRLLNVFLAILYLSVLLAGETRSASQAWADNTEAKFSHSQSLISQQTAKIADAEAPKDPETKHPVLLRQPLLPQPCMPSAALITPRNSCQNELIYSPPPRAHHLLSPDLFLSAVKTAMHS